MRSDNMEVTRHDASAGGKRRRDADGSCYYSTKLHTHLTDRRGGARQRVVRWAAAALGVTGALVAGVASVQRWGGIVATAPPNALAAATEQLVSSSHHSSRSSTHKDDDDDDDDDDDKGDAGRGPPNNEHGRVLFYPTAAPSSAPADGDAASALSYYYSYGDGGGADETPPKGPPSSVNGEVYFFPSAAPSARPAPSAQPAAAPSAADVVPHDGSYLYSYSSLADDSPSDAPSYAPSAMPIHEEEAEAVEHIEASLSFSYSYVSYVFASRPNEGT